MDPFDLTSESAVIRAESLGINFPKTPYLGSNRGEPPDSKQVPSFATPLTVGAVVKSLNLLGFGERGCP